VVFLGDLLLVVVFVAPAGLLVPLFIWARWLGGRTGAPRYWPWAAYVPLTLGAVATLSGPVVAVVGVLRAMSRDTSPVDRQRVLASGIAQAFYDGVLIVALTVVVALWLLFGTWRLECAPCASSAAKRPRDILSCCAEPQDPTGLKRKSQIDLPFASEWCSSTR
jgi:hypothetical protein